jgi:hypothetical protein
MKKDDLIKIKNSWNELIKLKEFKPVQEADVQCMLYHFLLKNGVKASNIFNNITESGYRIDIWIGGKKNPKILVEIKLVWYIEKGFNNQIRSLSNDIDKLRRIKRFKKYKANLIVILYVNPPMKKLKDYEYNLNKIKEKCKRDVLFLHN